MDRLDFMTKDIPNIWGVVLISLIFLGFSTNYNYQPWFVIGGIVLTIISLIVRIVIYKPMKSKIIDGLEIHQDAE